MLGYLRDLCYFRSFTGLTVSEFDSIYIEIESKYNEHERRRNAFLTGRRDREMLVLLVDRLSLKSKKDF